MGEARRQEALDWLTKASNSLLAAGVLAGASGEMARSLIFHTQQAAEYALQGYLAARGEQSGKAKGFPALLSQCAALNPAFIDVEPAKLDFPETAMAQARTILNLVRIHLPPEYRGA